MTCTPNNNNVWPRCLRTCQPKCASIFESKKGKRQVFLCPIKPKSHTSEEKGRKNRKREGEREEEKGKKLWLPN